MITNFEPFVSSQLGLNWTSLFGQLLQLHCQPHVSLDFKATLEVSLLSLQFSGQQLHEVIILHRDGDIAFVA